LRHSLNSWKKDNLATYVFAMAEIAAGCRPKKVGPGESNYDRMLKWDIAMSPFRDSRFFILEHRQGLDQS
jgi:hypothetical protein